MIIDFTLLGNPLRIDQPQELIGWVAWLVLLAILVILLFSWRKFNKRWSRLQGGIFVVLLILLLATNLLFVVHLPALWDRITPLGAANLNETGIMVFAALPWVLAAGLSGVFPATGLALLSGVIISLLDTHSPFTPLEFGLLAAFMGAVFHQRYRTWVFRLLRHPIFTTLLLALTYPLLYLIDTTLATVGSLAVRLDIALAQVEVMGITMGIQFLAAGVLSEAVAIVFPRLWGFSSPLEPSPVERRLQSRFLSSLAPLAVLVIAGLMAGDWFVAGKAANNSLQNRI